MFKLSEFEIQKLRFAVEDNPLLDMEILEKGGLTIIDLTKVSRKEENSFWDAFNEFPDKVIDEIVKKPRGTIKYVIEDPFGWDPVYVTNTGIYIPSRNTGLTQFVSLKKADAFIKFLNDWLIKTTTSPQEGFRSPYGDIITGVEDLGFNPDFGIKNVKSPEHLLLPDLNKELGEYKKRYVIVKKRECKKGYLN